MDARQIGLAHNPEPDPDPADILGETIAELQQDAEAVLDALGACDVTVAGALLGRLIYGHERDRPHYADLMRRLLDPHLERAAMALLAKAAREYREQGSYDREPF